MLWPGPTAIRVTGYYDMAVGDQPFFAEMLAAFNAMICEVAEANGAVCVDLVPAFNGPEGTADAGDLLLGDHIHASKAGQELIAAAIDATGYAPLHVVGLPAGSAAGGAAPGAGSPSPVAPMVLVSGVFKSGGGGGFAEDSEASGVVRQRGIPATRCWLTSCGGPSRSRTTAGPGSARVSAPRT